MTKAKYWAIALGAGLIVWLVLGGSLGISAGLVVFALGGLVLSRLFGGPAGETAVAEAMREASAAVEASLADPRPEPQAEAEDAAVMDAVRSQIEPKAEAPVSDPETVPEPEPEPTPEPEPEPMPEASLETTAAAPAEQAPAPDPETAPEPKAEAAPLASTLLAGEQELAARKGTWRYTPPAASSEAPAAADDSELLRIKGIQGPMLEKLQEEGITTLAQIAALDETAVAKLTEALGINKKDRIARQRWVEQAREMIGAEGGQ
ncbi:hypothetical protein [Pseudoruegeria sp. SHC-113]|uniref:hypothetical protein n=1 Tax=Pseudoruegeria sp. SHC-113 TaxID=2855439 RepID=UPI0021BAB240|nr:hypothetical protein [Pseudoruegeria sp. SHC-113]MCT8161169.1 hypothetical protein [Pseudoruegeria sp. SHC-113]